MNFKKITLLGIACLFPVLLFLILGSCNFFPFSRGSSEVSPKLLVKGSFSNIETIALTVSGPGMRTIERTFTDAGNVSIEVPAGNSRQFEIQVNINPSDPGAALSYYGSATVDLVAGASVTIPITMKLYETKLIIPDALNNRFVQIVNMSGDGWIDKEAMDIGLTISADFQPNDIDFDDQGRIYIANPIAGANFQDGVHRIDDINDTTGNHIVNAVVMAIAVDRVNNYLYYAIDNAGFPDDLHRCDFDGGNDILLTNTGVPGDIRGLAVDENGIVYIAYQTFIAAYDPVTENVLDTASIVISTYDYALDVMSKPPYIYAAVYDEGLPGSGNPRIVQFTFNGSALTEEASYFAVFGPHRFVGVSSRSIHFIDEDPLPQDRLVSIDDITGSNVQYYGTTGTGQGQYRFFIP